jgi:hypothetical protein
MNTLSATTTIIPRRTTARTHLSKERKTTMPPETDSTTIKQTLQNNSNILFSSSSTSTEQSEKAHTILLYVTYGLPFALMCVPISAFLVFSLCCHRKQELSFDEDSNDALDTISPDTYRSVTNDSDQSTSSSILSTQNNEIKSKNNLDHMFDDKAY